MKLLIWVPSFRYPRFGYPGFAFPGFGYPDYRYPGFCRKRVSGTLVAGTRVLGNQVSITRISCMLFTTRLPGFRVLEFLSTRVCFNLGTQVLFFRILTCTRAYMYVCIYAYIYKQTTNYHTLLFNSIFVLPI